MNDAHMRKIKSVLLRLWISEPESKTYLAWLQLWPSSVQQIANKTKIKRVTTHVIVQKLVNKWLFLESASKKKRLVYPSNLKTLNDLVDRKKNNLRILEKDVKDMGDIINMIQIEREDYPKVRIFEWIEWMTQFLKESLEDKKDMYVISNNSKFIELVWEDLIRQIYEKRIWLNLNTKMIFPVWFKNIWHQNKKTKYLIEIRIFKDINAFDGSMNIWWDKIALNSFNKNFLTTTIIENPEIAKMMKFIFDTLRTKLNKLD